MDTRFLPHNVHLEDAKHFSERDPQLRRLNNQPYVYQSSLLKQFPFEIPGIYTLGGGRQIGKTTLLKQWILQLLKKVQPESIAFLSGELIDDHHSLVLHVQQQLARMPSYMDRDHDYRLPYRDRGATYRDRSATYRDRGAMYRNGTSLRKREGRISYILLDEVSYIKDWDKAVKYMADAGMLDNVVLMLTGSDLTFIQEARMRFPGRRGKASVVDFHMYPLSFREMVQLVAPKKLVDVLNDHQAKETHLNQLYQLFNQYLIHGGFMTAINNYAEHKKILPATFATYSDWIRGDMVKRGKQEHYLKEILSAIIKHYGSQITWNNLAHSLSIDHPKTVMDYVMLLESMDAVFVQSALIEDKLVAAPKKARKLMFQDPFIYHAVYHWLYPTKEKADIEAKLVEASVITHYRRHYPTYYIKADGEVDLAYIANDRFWPIEIKWSNQNRSKDLKQISKYKNGKIFSKSINEDEINGIKTEPLPLALYYFDDIDGRSDRI